MARLDGEDVSCRGRLAFRPYRPNGREGVKTLVTTKKAIVAWKVFGGDNALAACRSVDFGAPRSMNMGTIRSLGRYDAAARRALQSVDLRHPACATSWHGAARPFLAAIMIQEACKRGGS